MNYVIATLGVEALPTAGIKTFIKRYVVIASDHYFVRVRVRSKPLHKTAYFGCCAGVRHVTTMNQNITCWQRLQGGINYVDCKRNKGGTRGRDVRR